MWSSLFKRAGGSIAKHEAHAAKEEWQLLRAAAKSEGKHAPQQVRDASRAVEQEVKAAAKRASAAKPGGVLGYIVTNPIRTATGVSVLAVGAGGAVAVGKTDFNKAITDTEDRLLQGVAEAEKALIEKPVKALANSPLGKALGVGGVTIVLTMGVIFVVYEGYTLYRRASG